MKILYWHTLPDDLVDHLFQTGITWGEVMEQYAQPPWCRLSEALNGTMGCWTLTDRDLRKRISAKFCDKCEYSEVVKI